MASRSQFSCASARKQAVYRCHVWFRVRAGDEEEAAVAGGFPACCQSCVEPDLHLTNSHPFGERRAKSSSNRARLLARLGLMSNALMSDVASVLQSVAESDFDGSVLVILNQADDSRCCLLNSVQ